MEWVDMPKEGKILEFAQSFFSIDPDEKTPFTVGVVELTNGVRMLARIVSPDLKVGEKVALVRCTVAKELPYWEFETARPT